ncbi:transcription antitermination factor NusB [Desulfofundulus thermosubterraneus]|uniref:Transcription antitermination protein NusB n=1 Tax=Desulfofundulus thermosubterraneus DSM 16057 TaxID=1121432 RepID=A0A1M6I593_9FIRM|nr:transcription antitermination factor NusB [Desulfofundulus thermosubterraneus]SHJ29611.1 NusB antitermination factor [Desulfofundulus thermosubterraneus DSM 16057]
MGRRQAREAALQVLYQVDVARVDPEEALNHLREMASQNPGDFDESDRVNEKDVKIAYLSPKDMLFARELVAGTLTHLKAFDQVIARLSRDWPLYRMAAVDRNIMRMALYEIFHREDIPNSVAVNEAVELAKTFGGPDSSRFINGILGRVVKEPASYYLPEGESG